jgi:hypothetical protein
MLMEFDSAFGYDEEWFLREEPDILKKSVDICCLSCCKFNYALSLWNMKCEFCGTKVDWRRADNIDRFEYILIEQQFKALKVHLDTRFDTNSK